MPRRVLHLTSLALLLVACTRCSLGEEPPPPFRLFGRGDMRPGVSIETLRDAAAKESRFYRWRCRPLWARAESCAITVQPGELRALVDSMGRVIRLTVVAPDSFFVWNETPRNEPKYRYYANRLREQWDSIRPHRFGPTERNVAEYRWVDRDGRWSAQMWYSPWSRYRLPSDNHPRVNSRMREQYRDSLARVPDSIAVTDEPEYSKFIALRPPPPEPEPAQRVAVFPEYERITPSPPAPAQQGQAQPLSSSLGISLGAALRELARAQEQYHQTHGRYATDVAALNWQFDPDVVLQLAGVTRTGWAAVASHRAVPSRSCVYFKGAVTRRPATFAQRREGIERSVVCDPF